MIHRLFPLLLLAFLLPLAAAAQPEFSDSTGTVHVKKKNSKTDPSIVPAKETFVIVEEMPSFPTAETGITMEDFIKRNFIVPQEAFDKGLSGAVIVQFVVEANGELTGIKVKKGITGCPACDAEALRVVQMMPPWHPGFQNGRPVPVVLSIPVKFRFNN